MADIEGFAGVDEHGYVKIDILAPPNTKVEIPTYLLDRAYRGLGMVDLAPMVRPDGRILIVEQT